MIEYCHDVLPGMLRDGCGVVGALADAIGVDVLARAEAFASLSGSAQDVLTAPFVEEVFDHRPVWVVSCGSLAGCGGPDRQHPSMPCGG
jgi:hypothetical protein